MTVLPNICEWSILVLFVSIYKPVNSLMETEEIEGGLSKYDLEGGRLDTDIQDLDQNIANVCNRLKKLDDILTKMYEDPPADGGKEFMRLSRTFNQASLDLLYFCTLDKHKALKAAKEMVDHGGPKFLEVDMDEEKMEQRFKWNGDSLDHMHIVRKDTQEHWYDLWHLYSSLP